MKKHFTRIALSMAILILASGTSDIATAPGTLSSDATEYEKVIMYYGTLSALSVPAAAAVDNGDNPLQALLKLIRESKLQIIEQRLLSPPCEIPVSDGPGRQPDSEKTQTAAAEDNGDNPLLAIQLRLKKLQEAEWQKAPTIKITLPDTSNDIPAPDGPGGQPATSAALLHTGAAASTDPCDPSFLSMLEEWSKQQGPEWQAAANSTPDAANDYETTLQQIQHLQQERGQLASESTNWAELVWNLYEKEQLSQHGNEEESRRKKEEEMLSKRFDKSVRIFDLLKKAKSPTGRKEVSIAIEFIQKRDELIKRQEDWSWSCFGGTPQGDFKKEFPKLVNELVELWRS